MVIHMMSVVKQSVESVMPIFFMWISAHYQNILVHNLSCCLNNLSLISICHFTRASYPVHLICKMPRSSLTWTQHITTVHLFRNLIAQKTEYMLHVFVVVIYCKKIIKFDFSKAHLFSTIQQSVKSLVFCTLQGLLVSICFLWRIKIMHDPDSSPPILLYMVSSSCQLYFWICHDSGKTTRCVYDLAGFRAQGGQQRIHRKGGFNWSTRTVVVLRGGLFLTEGKIGVCLCLLYF